MAKKKAMQLASSAKGHLLPCSRARPTNETQVEGLKKAAQSREFLEHEEKKKQAASNQALLMAAKEMKKKMQAARSRVSS
jgi:hypothetical protein